MRYNLPIPPMFPDAKGMYRYANVRIAYRKGILRNITSNKNQKRKIITILHE
jgi:hypothetical protein